ncbi:MAG: efflux RND transporter permease subunit [Acidobacteriota bacterium]
MTQDDTQRKNSRGSRLEEILPRFSLDRRITVLVLLATTLVVGLVATLGIPLELFPAGYTEPYLGVNVPWSDAPAREVMDKVILPLEEELSTVKGLDRLNSFSTTSFGRVFMMFKQGTDMDVAYREVRDRVQRARVRMPEDADRVYIRKNDTSGFPVAMVGLGVDPSVPDSYSLVEKGVRMPLERIDGVAQVRTQGLEEKEILIELDRERTEAAGLNIYAIAQDLAGDNFSLASGSVFTGGKKLLLRSVARYPDLDTVRERSVAPSVRVEDIARVAYEEPDKKYRVRVNGRPAVALEVMKEGEANTLEVSQQVHRVVEELQADPRLSGIEMTVFFDQGSVILESLSTLLDSGRIGAIFAIGVLFFFLRRGRMTLIITLSIPLSMLIALTVMFFAGESLNILSLLGLMICVGLLVDNAVVVAENIYRVHKEGAGRREACIRGAGEIALAVTMATLTTVIVFLPVSLVEGQAQFFLLRMAIPVSVSLLASLFVALVFIPLSVYLTLPARGAEATGWRHRLHRRVNAALTKSYNSTFERVNGAYGRLLQFFLGRRLELVMSIVLVAVVSGIAMNARELKVVEQDENESPGIEVDIELPQTYSFEETQRYFLEVEKVMEANKEKWGLDGHFFFHRTNWGEIEAWFPREGERPMTPRQVTEAVLAALPEAAGVQFYTGSEDEGGDDDKSIYRVTLNSEDPDQLEAVTEDLEDVYASVEGVLGIKKLAGNDRQPNELSLVVDRDRAQQQQVNPEVVAGVVGYALRGQSLPKFYQDGREIEVRVRFEEEDRESLTELAGFQVPTETGTFVPLASLTDVESSAGAKSIFRRSKRIARTITLELEEGKEDETRDRLAALTRRIDLPEGVTFGSSRRQNSTNEEAQAMAFAALMSVLFIYLLMGFLFESFILPLSIVFTIPLAGIGVIWAHVLANRDIDFLGMVGGVLLIGVVVNNGIVLIDYINRLRRQGIERAEAILLASSRRFRPIMMTALTTIFGMIPLTLGQPSTIGMSYKSFGFTLIGGLTTATLLTLLVVPVLYTLFDDARRVFDTLVRRVFRGTPENEVFVDPVI